ncbi:MAG: NfeD family protein [Bacillota bacterium]
MQFNLKKFKPAKCFLLAVLLIISLILINSERIIAQDINNNENPKGLVVKVEGTVTTGTARMLKKSLEEAERENFNFLLVELDTPGGLLDPTLEIMSAFLEAPIPIITYVSPAGAISASAGSFILLAGHKAAMTPGTSTGAAMPVEFSPTGSQGSAGEKTINFIAGHIRSVARERGRNEEVASKFVTENLTLTASEALEEGIVDSISRNHTQLLNDLDGQTVMIKGRETTLDSAGAELIEREMSILERIVNFIGNPQVTFLLLLLGIYGIIIGFSSPGTFIPEVGGAIALILALFGLGIIEVDYIGILLIGAGIFFLIVELFTPTFGIFTTIGVVLLVLGGFIFPGEPLMPPEWFANFRMLVLGVAVMSVLFILVALKKILNLTDLEIKSGDNRFKDKTGIVVETLNPEGQIKIEGEIWKAKIEGQEVKPGEKVKVINREGMTLLVKRLKDS